MEALLYLVHRIPYPPNKGDKIRSYHLLRHLSQHYKVYLGTFVDDHNDWQYVNEVKQYCEDTHIVGINTRIAKLKSLSGLLTNKALTIPYYYNSGMKLWVDETLVKFDIKRIVTFSSAMAQYVEHNLSSEIASVIDFVDVDSDKWNQYAATQKWPLSWLYAREAKTLLKYEAKMAKVFSKCLFVSKVEADLFVKLIEYSPDNIDFFNNGVDFDFFNPEEDLGNPFSDDEVMVFTGAMDYWANVDAICWFTKGIFPKIVETRKNAKLYIVGGNPTAQVRHLHNNSNVFVTGMVKDIRPYIKFASIIVVPLRIARGVQNKVLEAMAYNKIIVATPAAIEGIEECEAFLPMVGESETEIAQQCVKALNSLNADENVVNSRECIVQYYNWNKNLSKVVDAVEQSIRN